MFEISISNFIYICINLNNLEYNSWPGHFFETQHRLSFGYRCKFESNLRKGLFLQMPLQQTQKNSSGHAQWQTRDALGKQPYLAAHGSALSFDSETRACSEPFCTNPSSLLEKWNKIDCGSCLRAPIHHQSVWELYVTCYLHHVVLNLFWFLAGLSFGAKLSGIK